MKLKILKKSYFQDILFLLLEPYQITIKIKKLINI